MSESDLERWARKEIKKVGGRMLKFVSPGTKGVPDNIVLWPGGRKDFVEFKDTGKELDHHQREFMAEMAAIGITVRMYSDKEQVRRYIHARPKAILSQ